MKKLITLLICSLLITSSFAKLPTYPIDPYGITVGGLSSGAFFAVQMHFAFSKTIKGAAITAGGPFWCAQGNLGYALSNCMSSPQLIKIDALNKKAEELAKQGAIDPLVNLSGSKAYIYSGTLDDVVKPDVVKSLQKQYESYGVQTTTVYNVPSQHAYITTNFGNKCSFKGTPYINNCNYDMAYDSLSVLYDDLFPAITPIPNNLIEFDQAPYIGSNYSMNSKGYVYVPTACRQNTDACKLQVQFHGCLQTTQDIGTDYINKLGINGVAEANNIIVLYPQAKASKSNPVNPNGCWDWFAYTDNFVNTTKYVTKSGAQMDAIWKMVTDLVGYDPETVNIDKLDMDSI
ncbi:hypothetical protein ABPG72_008382 [Tetrahymena utriculariae]